MKIFDFSKGVKGRQLGEIYADGLLGRWVYVGGQSTEELRPEFKIGQYQYNQIPKKGEHSPIDLKAEFGVEAICFCSGKIGNEWDWHYQATDAWLEARMATVGPIERLGQAAKGGSHE